MTLMQLIFWLLAAGLNALALILWMNNGGGWLFIVSVPFTLLGIYDLTRSPHTLNRLYPVVAYLRYLLEHFHTEIHQYFVASNTSERPFNREQRSLVYRRAKNVVDTLPFGTQQDITEIGYLSVMHSLAPKHVRPEKIRVTVGGPDCTQPYSASRLNISAMSFGSLSPNAILALNKGAKLGDFAHNTGEGGLSPYHEQGGGDLIWQIGTGYFGCRTREGRFDEDLFQQKATRPQIRMIEIKLSQGAKPGHGGILPAPKVSAEIANIRGVARGEACISPPAHSAFDSPLGLLHFVARLRELSGGKPVGFKLCIGIKSEFMAICKAMLETKIYPDFITVDGAEGGTGAAPVEFSNRLGMPCLEGTYFVHNCLVGIALREHIKIISSGKTASGFDMLSKIALGADMVNAARTMMLALGCIQSLSCNTNNCPTGIATQSRVRGAALNVEAKHVRVRNFHKATVANCMELVGAMGMDNPDDLNPHHILSRVDDETSERYDQVYPGLRHGELLTDTIHPQYADDWRRSRADSFAMEPEITLS